MTKNTDDWLKDLAHQFAKSDEEAHRFIEFIDFMKEQAEEENKRGHEVVVLECERCLKKYKSDEAHTKDYPEYCGECAAYMEI